MNCHDQLTLAKIRSILQVSLMENDANSGPV